MPGRRALARLLPLLVLLDGARAEAQECLTCATAACPDLQGSLPACGPALPATAKLDPVAEEAIATCKAKGAGCARAADRVLDGAPGHALSELRPLLRGGCAAGDAAACSAFAAALRNPLAGPPQDGEALTVLRAACVKDPAVCVVLGQLVLDGAKSVEDARAAAAEFAQACNRGAAGGCGRLGQLYWTGTGIAEDPGKAATLARKGCDAKDGYSCNVLARMMRLGLVEAAPTPGAPDDDDENDDDEQPEPHCVLHMRACELGAGQGCSEWLDRCARDWDESERVPAYVRGCDAGELGLCGLAGKAHALGEGVAPDAPRGLAVLRRGCHRGDAECCLLAGELALVGRPGLDADPAAARRFLGLGCDLGRGGACTVLGTAVAEGTGGAADPAAARTLYRRGCEAGDVVGCLALAEVLLEGTGGPIDLPGAVTAAGRACHAEEFLVEACAWLGTRYATGEGGVKKDPAAALVAFERACRAESAPACHGAAAIRGGALGEELKDAAEQLRLTRRACKLGSEDDCDALERAGLR